MLGSSVKSVQLEVELSGGGDEGVDEPRGAGRKAAAADGRGMVPKRAKAPGGSGSMAKASAAELKVFKSGSVDSRVPGGPPASNLRKQKSLTNLSFLTDSEKKMQLYEPEWSDDMAKAPKGLGKMGSKGREAPLMSKTLSKSEHSLFQAKGSPAGGAKTPLAPLAPSLGKPSRIPRGPYAEVKPLSKAPEAAVRATKANRMMSCFPARPRRKRTLGLCPQARARRSALSSRWTPSSCNCAGRPGAAALQPDAGQNSMTSWRRVHL